MSAVAEPAARSKAPVLTLDGATAAAHALVPVLRERSARADELRRIPDETVRALHDTGLMRALQPRRVGGSEMDWVGLIDVSSELARGCGSTAWNWANWAVHHWMLALWPRQCQDEIWGADPDVLIASSLRVSRGQGDACGWRLSGDRTLALLERRGRKPVGHGGRHRPGRDARVPPLLRAGERIPRDRQLARDGAARHGEQGRRGY